MRIVLPVPPSANRYWRSCRGRVFVSAEAKAYKNDVARLTAAWQPFEGDVILSVDFYRPRKSGDLGNGSKFCGCAQVSRLP